MKRGADPADDAEDGPTPAASTPEEEACPTPVEGVGVGVGVDLGDAASKLRSFSCILRMTAVGVNETETELLERERVTDGEKDRLREE